MSKSEMKMQPEQIVHLLILFFSIAVLLFAYRFMRWALSLPEAKEIIDVCKNAVRLTLWWKYVDIDGTAYLIGTKFFIEGDKHTRYKIVDVVNEHIQCTVYLKNGMHVFRHPPVVFSLSEVRGKLINVS